MVIAGCYNTTDITKSRADNQQPVDAGCAPDNLTNTCLCADDQLGSQSCIEGLWTECYCESSNNDTGNAGNRSNFGNTPSDEDQSPSDEASTPIIVSGANPEANYSSVRFSWNRTASGGTCETGRYEGTFDGKYGPAISTDFTFLPVFTDPSSGVPGVSFDLVREGEIFTVSNGEMNANFEVGFSIHSDIEGSLNCETNRFEGRLTNGTYLIGPMQFFFEGQLVAYYDKTTHSMLQGEWSVTELEQPIAGGSGTWFATWIYDQ